MLCPERMLFYTIVSFVSGIVSLSITCYNVDHKVQLTVDEKFHFPEIPAKIRFLEISPFWQNALKVIWNVKLWACIHCHPHVHCAGPHVHL